MSAAARCQICVLVLRTTLEGTGGPRYVHAYWGMLDTIAHAYGVGSVPYTAELRLIDFALGELVLRGLRAPHTLLLLLADHGQINAPPERWIWLNDHPALLELLRVPPTGDQRGVVLQVCDGAASAVSAYVAAHLSHCAMVVPLKQALGLALYGLHLPPNRSANASAIWCCLPARTGCCATNMDANHGRSGRSAHTAASVAPNCLFRSWQLGWTSQCFRRPPVCGATS